MNKPTRPAKSQGGSLLIEAMIAIVIFSLGILAIIGMQASTMRATADAKNRLDASFLANQMIGEMWIKKDQLGSFQETNTAITGLPNATRSVAVNGMDVTITITWKLNGEPAAHKYTTVTRINGS
ncbi:hypothetical protein [Massilia sp. CF038]|uniref:type IV pilus modification PilV family protein n=1 Tax=Massilia sp. CF038 TaxID=1881045 RepID=UPI0009146408|nr:hypothetical protein [Massilia sp. CF038]SHG58462.1 type IV pilus assembly protein PilV [Massilia sp. CF038]